MKKDLTGVYDVAESTLLTGATVNILPSFVYANGAKMSTAQSVTIDNLGGGDLTVKFNGSSKARTVKSGKSFSVTMPVNLITMTNGGATTITYAVFMVESSTGDVNRV